MAQELTLLPNPDNVPGAVSSGYQRQNTNMYAISTGLNTLHPKIDGNNIIISAGGIIEINGALFVLQKDVSLTFPNNNQNYYIAIVPVGRNASFVLQLDAGTFNYGKNGRYDSSGKRVLPILFRKNIDLNIIQKTEINEDGEPITSFQIGDLYLTTTSHNPGLLFFGNWTRWGQGRVPVSVDPAQTEFATVEKPGGAKTHVLTIDEMPSHTHSFDCYVGMNGDDSPNLSGNGGRKKITTESAGKNAAHNNLQPYITCYMWKRTD